MPRLAGKVRIQISAGSCIFAALLLLVLPLQWVLAAMFAAGFHELCHACAVSLCGGTIKRLTLGSGGAVMEVESMTRGRELICALAGPFGGLLLLLFSRWIPRIAICAGVQSLYNLLPVYPLDGGRALRCGAALLLPGRGERICVILENCCLLCAFLLAVYASFWLKLGFVPIAFAAILLLKRKNTLQT